MTEPTSQRALPHRVADDTRLDMKSLCLFAYSVAHPNGFSLNKTEVKKRFGIGEYAFNARINHLQDLGYLERRQTYWPKTGKFSYAEDQINLDAAPDGRQGYSIWGRAAFDALKGLDAELVGLVVYLSSHAPGFRFYATNLAKRFNRRPQAMNKLLARLCENSIIKASPRRGANGRYEHTYYLRIFDPLDAYPNFREQNSEAFDPEVDDWEELDCSDYMDWLHFGPYDMHEKFYDESANVCATYDAISDLQLTEAIKAIAQGRIRRDLYETKNGKFALRRIIAVQVALVGTIDYRQATEDVLSKIEDFLNRDSNTRINSWGAIGKRMAWELSRSS